MDIRQLKYFVSIAQILNFTQAAKTHYITQPAISHQITELENEVGTKLFVRSKQRVVLTAAGEAFLSYAINILDTADAATIKARNIATGKEGYLYISAVPTCSKALKELLIIFKEKYPNIDVRVDFSTGREQRAAISKNEYDFYFSFKSLIQDCENLRFLETKQDRFGIFLPEKYASIFDPEDFSTLNTLDLAAELHAAGPYLVDQMLLLCAARGIDTSRIVGCRNHMDVFFLVSAELAYAIFPLGMLDCISRDRIITYPLSSDDAVVANAVGWNDMNGNNSADLFRDLLYEKFQKPNVM